MPMEAWVFEAGSVIRLRCTVRVRKNCAIWILAVLAAVLLHGSGFAREPFTVDPKVLSQLRLDPSESENAATYLGIRGKEPFTLPQVAAKTLIIEVFSMYCPHCQADAPEVNKLYRHIQENPSLRKNVKLIGVGAGNTTFEVNLFKEKFKVPFPVFSDEDFAVQKACSRKLRTPLFVIVKPEAKKKQLTVLHVHVGKINDAEAFLKKITHLKKQ